MAGLVWAKVVENEKRSPALAMPTIAGAFLPRRQLHRPGAPSTPPLDPERNIFTAPEEHAAARKPRGRSGDIQDVAVVNVDGGDGRVLEAHFCVVVLCLCSLFFSCFSSAEETADERGVIID